MGAVLNEENTEVIIAGPGVGKTTALLNRIEAALLDGVKPEEIAFFSFSTTAVNEGLSRIVDRMKYKRSQFRYFKTLHAMAFYLLGLETKQVISYGQLRQFAKENDYRFPSVDYRTGVARYQTQDAVLLSQIDSSRLFGYSIREYFTKNHIEESIARAEEMAQKYVRFKRSQGVVDFTDMILLANKQEFDTPYFKYMFVDEAQDLSTQQWQLVSKLALNADNIVVVGDERQAIAEYAGADVDCFLSIKGKITELNKSYRVPRAVYNVARKIEKYMIKTRNSEWFPRDKEFKEKGNGEVIRVTELPVREMSRGSWLILTRTNSQLTEFRGYMMQYCDILPTFFLVDGVPPIDPEVFKAIQIFESMNETEIATKYDFIDIKKDDSPEQQRRKKNFILLLKKFMSSKDQKSPELDKLFMHRFQYKNWYDAFDRIPIPERKYIASIRKAYMEHPDSFEKARIKLSTIHSAKGTEADNVILYTVLTSKVYKNWVQFRETDDTEIKVLFVALTRARKKLYLLGNPKVRNSYMEVLD